MKYFRLMASVAILCATPLMASAETVGAAMNNFADVFQTIVRNAIITTAKDEGVTLELADAKTDGARQVEQIKAFVEKGVDAIIVNMADTLTVDQLKEISSIADTKNVPLVFVNVTPPIDQYPVPFAIAVSNELVAGRLQMRKAASLMNGKGTVFVFQGQVTHNAAISRTLGVKQVLKSYPGIRIVEETSANWSRDEARKIMTDWLSKGNKVDAVIANNDEMALGAIEAYQALGIPIDNVIFGGVDATSFALEAMEKGTLTFTVQQNAAAQGKRAVEDAVKLSKGELVPEYDWIAYELITDKNLSQYLKK